MAELSYDGPATLKANQLFRCALTVMLHEEIEPGGEIALAARHVSDLADAQDLEPAEGSFARVSCSRPGVRLALSSNGGGRRHPWNRGMEIRVLKGMLLPGDRVVVELGGTRGFRCQSFAEKRFRFRLGTRRGPEAAWQVARIEDLPWIEITGSEAVRARVRVPDVNAAGEGARVCIKLEDAYGNAAAPGTAELDLLLDDKRHLGTVRVSEGTAEIAGVALPRDGQWHRLTVASGDGRFFARSNPFGPSLVEGYRLFWGEIHCQSALCDGTNRPADLYEYARKAGGLDFAAVSSHDMELSPDDWEEIRQATRQAHEPGRFVTFLGYEWSGATNRGGDHSIYFAGDEGPLVYNGPVLQGDDARIWGEWCSGTKHASGQWRTLAETISEIRASGIPFLVVPHCGGRRASFDFYDAAVMPLFEIHSCHRNYEDVAFEATGRAIPFGFIGGSDDHRGLLGDSVPAARERFFSSHCGLAAVYARELTRESLWEALFARRTYATNGCRMALLFRAGSALMGDSVRTSVGSTIRFEFEAVLDGYFDHAELVRGTETIARFSQNRNQLVRFAGGREVTVLPGTTAYYVRVYQTDGGIAWSSPVWVTGT